LVSMGSCVDVVSDCFSRSLLHWLRKFSLEKLPHFFVS
jgi:hypothetical protein